MEQLIILILLQVQGGKVWNVVIKHFGKRPLGRPRRKWEGNINRAQEINSKDVNLIELSLFPGPYLMFSQSVSQSVTLKYQLARGIPWKDSRKRIYWSFIHLNLQDYEKSLSQILEKFCY